MRDRTCNGVSIKLNETWLTIKGCKFRTESWNLLYRYRLAHRTPRTPPIAHPDGTPDTLAMKLALLFALTAAASAIDECGDAADCTACLNPSHGSGNCGWCSPTPIVYADGFTGKRCADLRDTSHGGGWQCYGKLETDQCLQGWVCGGDATKYQCVPAQPGEGTPSYADCQAGCTPRPSFKCSDPKSGQCVACADPADPSCTHNYTACQDGCVDASLYSCNSLSGKCEKCAKGDPGCVPAAECSATCSVKYGCDFPTNTSAKPTCKPCKDPKSQDCKYASEGDCTRTSSRLNPNQMNRPCAHRCWGLVLLSCLQTRPRTRTRDTAQVVS